MPKALLRPAAIILGAVALLMPQATFAASCSDEIAMLQNQIASRSAAPVDLPEGQFATLHRQPTRASVAKAQSEADAKAVEALKTARRQHAAGKDAECLKTLEPFVGL